MATIKFCPGCTAPYEAQDLYCSACGKILAK